MVAFYQRGTGPYFVLGDYLFQLKTNVGFPLGYENEWKDYIEKEDITVDWLLEHIYSAAQNIVFNHADILFPQEQMSKASDKPDPEMKQKILFQAVTFGALLLVCYISGKWTIPQDKVQIIVDTIMKTNISSYASTQNIIDEIDKSIRKLLELPEKKE